MLQADGDEHRSTILFDTNNLYGGVKFKGVNIMGSERYGYRQYGDREYLEHDQCYIVSEGDTVTYFKAPIDFTPNKENSLELMIAEACNAMRLVRA